MTIAEGFTSTPPQPWIEAGYRMFAAASLAELCPAAAGVRRLRAAEVPDLRVGQEFRLSSLRIDALGDRGELIPHVPIAIEVCEEGAGILDLRSDSVEQSFGVFVPVRPGAFTIRVRALCNSGPVLDLVLRVSSWPPRAGWRPHSETPALR